MKSLLKRIPLILMIFSISLQEDLRNDNMCMSVLKFDEEINKNGLTLEDLINEQYSKPNAVQPANFEFEEKQVEAKITRISIPMKKGTKNSEVWIYKTKSLQFDLNYPDDPVQKLIFEEIKNFKIVRQIFPDQVADMTCVYVEKLNMPDKNYSTRELMILRDECLRGEDFLKESQTFRSQGYEKMIRFLRKIHTQKSKEAPYGYSYFLNPMTFGYNKVNNKFSLSVSSQSLVPVRKEDAHKVYFENLFSLTHLMIGVECKMQQSDAETCEEIEKLTQSDKPDGKLVFDLLIEAFIPKIKGINMKGEIEEISDDEMEDEMEDEIDEEIDEEIEEINVVEEERVENKIQHQEPIIEHKVEIKEIQTKEIEQPAQPLIFMIPSDEDISLSEVRLIQI